MSDRAWDVAKGVGLLLFGLLAGTALDGYKALGDKAENAATKDDIRNLRSDMRPVLLLASKVERNREDIKGLDSRQRTLTQIANMLCAEHNKPCPTRNAVWVPQIDGPPLIAQLVYAEMLLPLGPEPAPPRRYRFVRPAILPKLMLVRYGSA